MSGGVPASAGSPVPGGISLFGQPPESQNAAIVNRGYQPQNLGQQALDPNGIGQQFMNHQPANQQSFPAYQPWTPTNYANGQFTNPAAWGVTNQNLQPAIQQIATRFRGGAK